MITIMASGFIAEKPELLLVGATNTAKCEFDVVSGRREYRKGNPETVWERATFVAWDAEAEKIAERLDRGTSVTCTGLQETSTWTDGSGQKRRKVKHRLTAWMIEPQRHAVTGDQGQRAQPTRQSQQPQARPQPEGQGAPSAETEGEGRSSLEM